MWSYLLTVISCHMAILFSSSLTFYFHRVVGALVLLHPGPLPVRPDPAPFSALPFSGLSGSPVPARLPCSPGLGLSPSYLGSVRLPLAFHGCRCSACGRAGARWCGLGLGAWLFFGACSRLALWLCALGGAALLGPVACRFMLVGVCALRPLFRPLNVNGLTRGGSLWVELRPSLLKISITLTHFVWLRHLLDRGHVALSALLNVSAFDNPPVSVRLRILIRAHT